MVKFLFAFVIAVSCMAAQAQDDCHRVSGSISTNFLNPNTTFGSATGDLAGGIGVTVLSLKDGPAGVLTLHNQHHWVTITGDTINADPADAVAYPSGIAGLYAASYPDGVPIKGGTGKFRNATGKIFAWGAIDTSKNEVVLRYEGKVCFMHGND